MMESSAYPCIFGYEPNFLRKWKDSSSWDPITYGFAPIPYSGSSFSAGVVDSDGECTEGF